MIAKTHISVAMASTLLITQPKSIEELILCLGVAPVGAVISDIDISTSESHEAINRLLRTVAISLIILGFAEYNWNLGIIAYLKNDSNIMRIIIGIGAILGICIFGKNKPHRSFMHSILAVVLLTFSIYNVFPKIVPYFVISMSSHILIDTLNKKKVHILYPLPGGIAFNLCKANGIVNNILFKVSNLLTIISLIYFTAKIGAGFLI